jgi:hypothetical protein
MMTNKALRLPIILLALMVMGGMIQWLRPKNLEPKPFRDASNVETFNASQTGNNVIINGHKMSDLANTESSYKTINFQKAWNLSDIQHIEGRGGKQILVFVDGSTREVTPLLYKQLPGNIQVRLSYERQD